MLPITDQSDARLFYDCSTTVLHWLYDSYGVVLQLFYDCFTVPNCSTTVLQLFYAGLLLFYIGSMLFYSCFTECPFVCCNFKPVLSLFYAVLHRFYAVLLLFYRVPF